MQELRLVEADIETSDADAMRTSDQPKLPVRKLIGAAVVVMLAGTGAWAGVHFAFHGPAMAASSKGEVQQLLQIIAKPKRGACSNSSEDCFGTGCCNVVGYTCFQTKPSTAKCMKSCTPSASQLCTQPQSVMEKVLQDADPITNSLYCFSLYTENTGSTKPSEELQILKRQFSKKISIFACQEYDVFGDVEVEVGAGLKTTMVTDVDGDFHFAKRKNSGTWVNTGIFKQVWKAIGTGDKYKTASWVVKVDVDAVFLPSRLAKMLQSQMVPSSGIYLENCKYVDYGYFGNLEVFSQAAFATLLQNIDTCNVSPEINWKVGVKNGKYGPMGEDLFAQTCLDSVGVRRVEAFDITTDGACPAHRPLDQKTNKKWQPNCGKASTAAMHPFKKEVEWFECFEATTAAFGY
jgi:hypothetical protein